MSQFLGIYKGYSTKITQEFCVSPSVSMAFLIFRNCDFSSPLVK